MIPSRLHRNPMIKILNPACPLVRKHPLNRNLLKWNMAVPDWGDAIMPDLANPQYMSQNNVGFTSMNGLDGDAKGPYEDGTTAKARRIGVINNMDSGSNGRLHSRIVKFNYTDEGELDFVPRCPGHLGYLLSNSYTSLVLEQKALAFNSNVRLSATWCFWLSRSSWGGLGGLLYGERSSSGNHIFKFSFLTSSMGLTMRTHGDIVNNGSIFSYTDPGWTDNKWRHVAITFSVLNDTGYSMKLYINGEYAGGYNGTGYFSFNSSFPQETDNGKFTAGIGRDYYDTRDNFNGNIASIKIFKGVFDTDRVRAEYRSAFTDFEGQINYIQLPVGKAGSTYPWIQTYAY